MKVQLVLENGERFIGDSFGFELKNNFEFAEVVFNTAMTGYQEIITDPSYCDQFITLTYPLIGNYGINKDDFESLTPYLKGVIVHEVCETPSNYRCSLSLSDYLKKHKIPGITGVDTRRLTQIIRQSGVLKAILAPVDYPEHNFPIIFKSKLPEDQIQRTSVNRPIHFPGKGKRIVLLDFGHKKNILKSLLDKGCDVIVLPWNSSFEVIRQYSPDGVLLSNGPGDPMSVASVVGSTILEIQKNYPMFCICMGHQLFALANGAKTEKMKFGHRGGNHPVKDFGLDRVFITSQNHGYHVVTKSVENTDIEITQVNLNDESVEGLRHKKFKSFSVQYHPEAAPGPEDTHYLFDEFLNSIEESNHAKKN